MIAPFAMHPNDEKQSLAMMKAVQERGASRVEAEAAIQDHLTAQHEMRKQMQRVEEKLKAWLS